MGIVDGLLFGLGFWGIAWLLLGWILIGTLANTVEEFFIAPVIAFLIYLGVFQFVFDVPIFQSIRDNGFMLIVYLFGYAVIGSAFTGFWKLPNKLHHSKGKAATMYAGYLRDHKLPDTPENRTKFKSNTTYNHLHPRNLLDDLFVWVLLWPFVMTVDVLTKPIAWAWNNGYALLGKWFDAIVFRFIDKELTEFDDK